MNLYEGTELPKKAILSYKLELLLKFPSLANWQLVFANTQT